MVSLIISIKRVCSTKKIVLRSFVERDNKFILLVCSDLKERCTTAVIKFEIDDFDGSDSQLNVI